MSELDDLMELQKMCLSPEGCRLKDERIQQLEAELANNFNEGVAEGIDSYHNIIKSQLATVQEALENIDKYVRYSAEDEAIHKWNQTALTIIKQLREGK